MGILNKGNHRADSGKQADKSQQPKNPPRTRRNEGPAATGDNIKTRNANKMWQKQAERRANGNGVA